MIRTLLLYVFLLHVAASYGQQSAQSWIRINQLGYLPEGVKVAVWCSKENITLKKWELIDAATRIPVASGEAGKAFGAYGPFAQSYRLDFSSFKKPGRYMLKAGNVVSPAFTIGEDVYKGAADFCLRYMRQQRTGFNPFLNDSCHTRDGYTLYGGEAGLPDSTYIDVAGGWHDASDYLQYSTTSANATYHLLMAYRDFPKVFTDQKQANGLDAPNGVPDVLDEARWGLQWLLKMHPRPDYMFNQIADDRDHISMRMPGLDSQYGRGHERPVYFINGKPQQRGKFLNQTKGTSSTAAKFTSAFALAHRLYETDSLFRNTSQRHGYADKAWDAYRYALKIPGVTQTASVKAPYIYEEENWTDDMELATASLHRISPDKEHSLLTAAFQYAFREPITPWLGKDTARHYQWYPFINLGHYELAKQLPDTRRDTLIDFYRAGIEQVWEKAAQNAFYRGVPFIWCSNNLTVSFAIQCYWYRQLSSDDRFRELEQANFDWLFGCNPWGTSMVYGLPAWGDTPIDPHSAFTHFKKAPIDGGLIDGPVYTSIFKNLIGLKLYNTDTYAEFQSDLAVYHDDYGDYSTNEPTMDGTASLIYLLAAIEADSRNTNHAAVSHNSFQKIRGAITRGDSTVQKLSIVFTGHEFGEGLSEIRHALHKEKVKASFFFTGDFYRNADFRKEILALNRSGHYLGAHSDKHLLYCDWNKRDSVLISKEQFEKDLKDNYAAMNQLGISTSATRFFLPSYEWYNDTIAAWTKSLGLQLVNLTAGTKSAADYTWPELKNYVSSEDIYASIMNREAVSPPGLNGYVLLLHVGADPRRADVFYKRLPALLKALRKRGYQFQRIDDLLEAN